MSKGTDKTETKNANKTSEDCHHNLCDTCLQVCTFEINEYYSMVADMCASCGTSIDPEDYE